MTLSKAEWDFEEQSETYQSAAGLTDIELVEVLEIRLRHKAYDKSQRRANDDAWRALQHVYEFQKKHGGSVDERGNF